jgi:hypothetical protein
MNYEDYSLVSRGNNLLAEKEHQEHYYNLLKQQKEPSAIGYRRLREGFIAGRRIDAFTCQVYQESVHVCLKDQDELLKTLTGLIHTIYPKVESSHQAEYEQAYVLFNCCQ